MYKEKINGLQVIDDILTKDEWYYVTRWHGVAEERIRKANYKYPRDAGHLVLGNKDHSVMAVFKYTTVCREAKVMVSDTLPAETELVLRLPRKAEDYVKTWEGSTYIICSFTRGPVTTFYYINTCRFLNYLESALQPVDWEGQKIPRYIMHNEEIRISGLIEKGMIEMVDRYNRKTGYITIDSNTSPLSTPSHFRSGKCRTMNLWTGSTDKALWENWHLRPRYAANSANKRVRITAVATGNSVEYASLTEAAKSLSTLGKKVSKAQLSNCLRGLAKTFKTAEGKCIVEYII